MQQIYCNNNKKRNKQNKEGNIYWPKNLRGTYLQMLFRDNNWAALGDVCTRSLTVAMWIISFPKVLIGCALSEN